MTNQPTSRSTRCFLYALMAPLLLVMLLAGCSVPQAAPSPTPAATVAPVPPVTPAPVYFAQITPSPTPTPTPTPTPIPTPFSVVWLTDTQTLTYRNSLRVALPPMFEWIVDSKETHHSVLTVHTGDLVENGLSDRYWDRIIPSIHLLDGVMPFLPLAGNHDVGRSAFDYSMYLDQYFVKEQDPAAQFRDGRGYYMRIDAGGTSFLFVALGWGCTDERSFEWARAAFDAHPDCVGVLLAHAYMSLKNAMTPEGEQMREQIVARCPNVRIVMSGHVHSVGRRQDRFDDDGDGTPERCVNAMVYNYQKEEELDDSGYLRLLTFDPLTRSIAVDTYSPYLNDWIYKGDESEEQRFTLEDAF